MLNLLQTMDLKGQMIHLAAVDDILFLGTPSVEKLDELIEKGLYISDLPIHDATRDVILVGEQTKAQVGGVCKSHLFHVNWRDECITHTCHVTVDFSIVETYF